MSARFEEFVVFVVTSVLVSLFVWIYMREPQKTTRLWMLGWIAILVHFTVPAFDDFVPGLMPFTPWLMISTLLIAGTLFLLSVSEIFVQQTRRGTFLVFVTAAALLYLTGLRMHYPGRWFYISLLMASTVYGIRVAVNFYRWKGPYLHALFLLLPYVE